MHAPGREQTAIGRNRTAPSTSIVAPPSRRQAAVVAAIAGIVAIGAACGGVRLLADADSLNTSSMLRAVRRRVESTAAPALAGA